MKNLFEQDPFDPDEVLREPVPEIEELPDNNDDEAELDKFDLLSDFITGDK